MLGSHAKGIKACPSFKDHKSKTSGRNRNHTLWALENASLATTSECLVEVRAEHGIGNTAEVVVGNNVFLDCLATVEEKRCQQTISSRGENRLTLERHSVARKAEDSIVLTWIHFSP